MTMSLGPGSRVGSSADSEIIGSIVLTGVGSNLDVPNIVRFISYQSQMSIADRRERVSPGIADWSEQVSPGAQAFLLRKYGLVLP